MQAKTVNMIEITLPDVDGVNRSLSDELKHGKATVVIFAVMNHPDSPTFNRKMAEILASKAGSVRFYQVSYDDDMYAWRDAARNLPWTNVFDINGAASTVPAQYNVENLPSFYIYSPEGELVDKAETIDDLTKKLSKY